MPRNFPNHSISLRALSAAFILPWLAACGSSPASHQDAYAEAANPPQPDESFMMASTVGEDVLSDMRGGFVVPGGLQITFGLSQTTVINGIITNSFTLTGNDLNARNLQQTIQTGGGNVINSSTPTALGNSVVTVVQNSLNNATIQKDNILNLTVSNLNGLRDSAAMQSSIGPLVRSLR